MHRPLLASAAILAAVMAPLATAEAALVFADPLQLGVTQSTTFDVTDAYSDDVTFTLARSGNVRVSVYGLTDSIQGVAGFYGDVEGVGVGNLNNGGSAGNFTIASLAAGTYSFDLVASTIDISASGTGGVDATLTPIPAGLALLAPVLAGLGIAARRRRAAA